jgi:hypothetical protein
MFMLVLQSISARCLLTQGWTILKDDALSQRYDALAHLPHGLRIAQYADKLGIDTIFV